MRRLFLTYVLALLASVSMAQVAEAGDASARADGAGAVEVLPDSSNFVTASILISSPGKELFFALGHCGLRLQCPSKGLDYCFSFSTIVPPGPEFNLLLLSGKMKAGYEALPYDEYLDTFRKDGRGVVEYPLNLTLSEERELWRKMDNLMMKGPTMKFDFLLHNCTSTIYHAVGSILESEHFAFPSVYPLNLRTRDAFHELFKDAPWLEFMGLLMLSSPHPDSPSQIDLLLCPSLFASLLSQGEFVAIDGSRRPILEGAPKETLPLTAPMKTPFLSPVWVFGLLLMVLSLVTLSEWLLGWRRLAAVTDRILFVIYTLLAVYLLYASCFRLYGCVWNRFFLVINLLPFLLWLLFRKKAFYRHVWGAYSVALIAFAVYYCLVMSRMEWAVVLMLSCWLVRCASRYFLSRRSV